MVSRRREEGGPALDVPPPPQLRRWPLFVFVGVVALGVAVVWLILALRPDPCDGANFRSNRFGYCLSVPEGWAAQPASIGGVTVDHFSVPHDVAAVVVTAIDLPSGIDLRAFTSFIRGQERQGGLKPGEVKTATLGGAQAKQWEIISTGPSGETFRSLEVVAVNRDFGWTVELADTQDAFERHVGTFREMLASWKYA
jgi:hypothetical protein